MSTQISEFALSDGEKIIRTYESTKLVKFLAPTTIGYLTITNKRIVYHSQGKSISGSSALFSEIPLEDISGVSTSISASFSWLMFLVFCGTLYFVTTLLSQILPAFFTGWVMAIFLILPYLIGLLFQKNILSLEIQQQISQNISELPTIGEYLKKKDFLSYMNNFRIAFFFGLALFAWNLVTSSSILYRSPVLGFALLIGAYYFIYSSIFGKARTFSLAITSKAAKNSGIYIPGNVFSNLFGGGSAAQTLSAGPANDAETIVHELGAMLTDIRHLGDMGIQKWSTKA